MGKNNIFLSRPSRRELHPTDAFRKQIRKKEKNRNKRERVKIREQTKLKKNPEVVENDIKQLRTLEMAGSLDGKARHRLERLKVLWDGMKDRIHLESDLTSNLDRENELNDNLLDEDEELTSHKPPKQSSHNRRRGSSSSDSDSSESDSPGSSQSSSSSSSSSSNENSEHVPDSRQDNRQDAILDPRQGSRVEDSKRDGSYFPDPSRLLLGLEAPPLPPGPPPARLERPAWFPGGYPPYTDLPMPYPFAPLPYAMPWGCRPFIPPIPGTSIPVSTVPVSNIPGSAGHSISFENEDLNKTEDIIVGLQMDLPPDTSDGSGGTILNYEQIPSKPNDNVSYNQDPITTSTMASARSASHNGSVNMISHSAIMPRPNTPIQMMHPNMPIAYMLPPGLEGIFRNPPPNQATYNQANPAAYSPPNPVAYCPPNPLDYSQPNPALGTGTPSVFPGPYHPHTPAIHHPISGSAIRLPPRPGDLGVLNLATNPNQFPGNTKPLSPVNLPPGILPPIVQPPPSVAPIVHPPPSVSPIVHPPPSASLPRVVSRPARSDPRPQIRTPVAVGAEGFFRDSEEEEVEGASRKNVISAQPQASSNIFVPTQLRKVTRSKDTVNLNDSSSVLRGLSTGLTRIPKKVESYSASSSASTTSSVVFELRKTEPLNDNRNSSKNSAAAFVVPKGLLSDRMRDQPVSELSTPTLAPKNRDRGKTKEDLDSIFSSFLREVNLEAAPSMRPD